MDCMERVVKFSELGSQQFGQSDRTKGNIVNDIIGQIKNDMGCYSLFLMES